MSCVDHHREMLRCRSPQETLRCQSPPDDVEMSITTGRHWLWTQEVEMSFTPGRHCDVDHNREMLITTGRCWDVDHSWEMLRYRSPLGDIDYQEGGWGDVSHNKMLWCRSPQGDMMLITTGTRCDVDYHRKILNFRSSKGDVQMSIATGRYLNDDSP